MMRFVEDEQVPIVPTSTKQPAASGATDGRLGVIPRTAGEGWRTRPVSRPARTAFSRSSVVATDDDGDGIQGVFGKWFLFGRNFPGEKKEKTHPERGLVRVARSQADRLNQHGGAMVGINDYGGGGTRLGSG